MKRHSDGQLELVLENRQLLLTFFVIVALCGVFFSLGYIVGRNTLSGSPPVAQASAGTADTGSKPSPMPPPAYSPTAPEPPAAEAAAEQPTPTTDLNFYQSVEEKQPDAKLEPAEPSKPTPPSQPLPASTAQTPPVAEPPAGIMVQVSALTRREDANALVNLLKEKNLPVLVLSGSSDNLFHVMVGPYTNPKDAERTKAILELDGFRPIVKR